MLGIFRTLEHFHVHISNYNNDLNKLRLYYINGTVAGQ